MSTAGPLEVSPPAKKRKVTTGEHVPNFLYTDKQNVGVKEGGVYFSKQGNELELLNALSMNDWECLQRGLSGLRRFKARISGENLRSISQFLLKGEFANAEMEAYGIGQREWRGETSTKKAKENMGAIMKSIVTEGLGEGNDKTLDAKANERARFRYALERSKITSCRDTARKQCRLSAYFVGVGTTVHGTTFDSDLRKILCLLLAHNKEPFRKLAALLPTPIIDLLLDRQLLPSSNTHCDVKIPTPQAIKEHKLYKIMSIIYNVALKGNQKGAKHGAVLFDNRGELLSIGWNHRYDVPSTPLGYKVIHAEVHALAQLRGSPEKRKRAIGGTIYIGEIDRNNYTFCHAQPCKNCTPALAKTGVARALYTSNRGELWELNVKHNTEVEAASYDLALRFPNFKSVNMDAYEKLNIPSPQEQKAEND